MGKKGSSQNDGTIYTALPFWKLNVGLKVLLAAQFGQLS